MNRSVNSAYAAGVSVSRIAAGMLHLPPIGESSMPQPSPSRNSWRNAFSGESQRGQQHDRTGGRRINGHPGLRVPAAVVREHCRRYQRHGKPIHRMELTDDSVFTIIATYQQAYRGVVEYYRLAYNLHTLDRLKWVMGQSLAKTLAVKLRISVKRVYRRFRATLQTDRGPRQGLQVIVERGEGKRPVVAQWGGISLAWLPDAVLDDHPRPIFNRRAELLG